MRKFVIVFVGLVLSLTGEARNNPCGEEQAVRAALTSDVSIELAFLEDSKVVAGSTVSVLPRRVDAVVLKETTKDGDKTIRIYNVTISGTESSSSYDVTMSETQRPHVGGIKLRGCGILDVVSSEE